MNRICFVKATNQLIEFQSGKAKLGTLTQNAINAGFLEEDIEELYTEDDLQTVSRIYETAEDKTKREDKEDKSASIAVSKKIILDKYKTKKAKDITDTDLKELQRLEVAEKYNIDV